MTTAEFSNEFDILYNNITSNMAPGISEYEKSVFLTRAQEELVLGFYNGRNLNRTTFEETEESRRYLNSLVKTSKPALASATNYNKLISTSVLYNIPSDVWFITYEEVKLIDDILTGGKKLPYNTNCIAEVVPTTQDSYFKKTRNPFKMPNDNKVFKIDGFSTTNIVELISNYKIDYYLLKYLSQPTPIVLETMDGGATINNVAIRTECSLHQILHISILKMAVDMAKVVYDSQKK